MLQLLIFSFKDINECASINGDCEQLCNNSIGSYWCSCLTGYTLDTNDMNCSGTPKTIIIIIKLILITDDQILMSVKLTMEVVNRLVLILCHPISVHAVKDSNYIIIFFVQVLILQL